MLVRAAVRNVQRVLQFIEDNLRDPSLSCQGDRHLSVTTIGFNWGFKDAGHFGRAFKQQIGCTPTDARVREGGG